MRRLFLFLFFAAAALLFLLNAPTLDMLGYPYSNDSGPVLTRIHPATFLLAVALVVAIVLAPYRLLRELRSPVLLFFLFATVCLLIRAVMLVMSGITGGELTLVITNFLTPILAMLCVALILPHEANAFATFIRLFFVVNSLVALAERAVGHRFIPSILDRFHDPRAAALVGHPLNGAVLTGLIIIFLVSARRGRMPVWMRFGEIALHAAALFAFGGRSAIVFTPVILLLQAVAGRNRAGEAKISFAQRAAPFALLMVGVSLTMLPIKFVDDTLDRFTQDNGSAQTRNSAIEMISRLPMRDLLTGLNVQERMALSRFYNTTQGIELSWVALLMDFGLIAVLPMMVAFPLYLLATARSLDRSAFYMVLFFLFVTFGSLSIGVKSLLVVQLLLMMLTLARARPVSLTFRESLGAASRSETSGAVSSRDRAIRLET